MLLDRMWDVKEISKSRCFQGWENGMLFTEWEDWKTEVGFAQGESLH